MRLGRVLHGEAPLATKAKSTRSQERHGLIDGFGRTVGPGYGEGDAQVGCVLIGEGGDPLWTPSKVDGIGEPALSGRVEHGVDRRDDLAYPIGQTRSVADRDGAEVAHKVVVPGRRRADDCGTPGDGELGGDHPDRAGGTEHKQSLAPGEPQLLQGAHCGFCRSGQGSSIAPGNLRRLRGPGGCESILAVAAQSGQEAGDFVPFFDPRDGRPERVDDTSRLEPENCVRGTCKPDFATPDLQIGGADP